MNIMYIILGFVIIVFAVIAFLSLYRLKEKNKIISNLNNDLSIKTSALSIANEEIIKRNANPIIIGKIDKYTDQEILMLEKNKEFIEIVMKYLEYEIAIKTDTMRNMSDGTSPSEKAGYLNGLHATYLFFYKIKNKKIKEDKYTGQELV